MKFNENMRKDLLTWHYDHIDFVTTINDLLNNKKHFSLNRFGEGELRLLSGRRHEGEFKSVNEEWFIDEKTDQWFLEKLKAAMLYESPNYIKAFNTHQQNNRNYYTSIEQFKNIKTFFTGSFYEWIGSNQSYFYSYILNLLKQYEGINLICSKVANIKNTKINFNNCWNQFKTFNSWKQTDYINKTIDEINKYKNNVFLFTTGFSTKLMIKELHQLNPNNVYIDMGSTLNTKLYNQRRKNVAKKAP